MSPLLNRRHLIIASAFTLGGCSATGALNALVPGSTYRLEQDIAFGTHPRQRLDVYVPLARSANAPLAVFFYGGSWSRGDRESYRFVGEALASAGIVTVVADYRLSPQVRWSGILEDCAAAAAWTFRNATPLGASAERIYLMGHSAGAYNAAMLALDARWLAPHQLQPGRLAGWIGIAGPYDFLPIRDRETQRAFDWPATPADSQPLAHVSAQAPRTLLLTGRNDTTVDPQRNSAMLAQRLRRAGVPVELQIFDRVGHTTIIGALATPLRGLAPVRREIIDFIAEG